MSLNLSGLTILALFLAVVVVIVGLIFIIRGMLKSKDAMQLKDEFTHQTTASPLIGRNKYPQLDVFKSTGTNFGIGMVSALLMIFLFFNYTKFEKEIFVPEYDLSVEEDIMVQPPKLNKPPPPPPPPPPPVIEEVPEELVEEDEPVFEDQTIENETEVNTPPPPKPKKAAPPPPPPPPPPKKKIDEIFRAVEEMPRFPGCEDAAGKGKLDKCSETALLKFIYEYIEYPLIAKETGIEGRAIIQFVVDKNGSISGVKLLRGPGGGCGDEAKRVVALMNKKGIKWSPGRQQGQTVRVQYILPVMFKLE